MGAHDEPGLLVIHDAGVPAFHLFSRWYAWLEQEWHYGNKAALLTDCILVQEMCFREQSKGVSRIFLAILTPISANPLARGNSGLRVMVVKPHLSANASASCRTQRIVCL